MIESLSPAEGDIAGLQRIIVSNLPLLDNEPDEAFSCCLEPP